MDETRMMHGVPYRDEDVAGWLMSEKMNGCRAFWDGRDLWTRGGKIISAPPAMLALLPEGIMLDGEINAGRGQSAFELSRRAVQYGRFSESVVFSAFDAPDAGGTFAERKAFLRYILPDRGLVHYITHDTCPGIVEATRLMLAVQASNGEGMILRDPSGRYMAGRTDGILKLKIIPEALYDHDSLSSLRKAHQPRITSRER